MKSMIMGCFVIALMSSGCLLFETNSIMPEALGPQEKPKPVTVEEVNEKNAAEIGKRLNDEIQQDEQSNRGNTMDRSKLAIP